MTIAILILCSVSVGLQVWLIRKVTTFQGNFESLKTSLAKDKEELEVRLEKLEMKRTQPPFRTRNFIVARAMLEKREAETVTEITANQIDKGAA